MILTKKQKLNKSSCALSWYSKAVLFFVVFTFFSVSTFAQNPISDENIITVSHDEKVANETEIKDKKPSQFIYISSGTVITGVENLKVEIIDENKKTESVVTKKPTKKPHSKEKARQKIS